MAKKVTPNIGLELTDNVSTLFRDWWTIINGDGGTENPSNMQKIDAAFGDISAAVTGKVDKTVNDLVNYYNKSNSYSKDEVNSLIATIESVHLVKVEELPTTGESNTIYLVPDGEIEHNIFKEYIWVENAWELIGSTEVDLSNYATLDDIADFVDEEGVENIVEDVVAETIDEVLDDALEDRYATEDDIYEAMGIMNIEDREIEDTTLVLNAGDIIDENDHLLDFNAK